MVSILGAPFDAATGPAFSLHADGTEYMPSSLQRVGDDRWRGRGVEIALETTSTPDGSRAVTLHATGVRRVHEVCLLDHDLEPAPDEICNHRWFDMWGMQQSTAVFARHAEGGVFACYANPFGVAEIDGNHLRLAYRPGLDVDGTFRSDPLIVGAFRREGIPVRRELLVGRDIADGRTPAYATMLGPLPVNLDRGEVRAVRRAVAARVPWEPARMRVAHWDWSENLFRRPIDDPSTREMYARVIEIGADFGLELILVAPSHAGGYLHNGEEYGEGGDGPWQRVMWLGMGEAFGRGRWEPGAEPVGLPDILDAAGSHGIGVVGYANPQYLWDGRETWRLQLDPNAVDPWGGRYRPACLGHPDVQEWLIEHAERFVETYGLSGLSLDFVCWPECHATDHGHDSGPASRYAQWDGYRRIIRALHEKAPDGWLEGLIGSPQLMPWGVRDMVHPCPFMGDNQPQWVPAWPDLSQYRALGNYQRRTAFWYRNLSFIPSYKVPGLLHHQGNRIRWPTAERGWDWEGARYNLLSALASAPSTLAVCFLPGWDEAEWRAVREREMPFYRQWIDFAKEHADVLSRLEDLFDEPCPGAVDGTIALDDEGRGFAFLCNPDFEPREVCVPLPADRMFRELHPAPGRLWRSQVVVEPHQIHVLEVLPVEEVTRPALIGAFGRVDETGRVLDARGAPGTETMAEAWLPSGATQPVRLRFDSDGVAPTLGPWSDDSGTETGLDRLDGSVHLVTSWVPGSALPELLGRLAPGVAAEGDERLQPWSDPARLRLFLELTDPITAKPKMRVNGREVAVQPAYIGTYEDVKDTDLHPLENNMLGWYADLTELLMMTDDLSRPWQVEVEAELCFPGQLRGVHVAHLPRRETGRFRGWKVS